MSQMFSPYTVCAFRSYWVNVLSESDLTRNTVYCNLFMEALFSDIKPSESASVWTTSKKWFVIEALKLFVSAQFECTAKIINIVKLTQIKLPQNTSLIEDCDSYFTFLKKCQQTKICWPCCGILNLTSSYTWGKLTKHIESGCFLCVWFLNVFAVSVASIRSF